jgi:hypothetical protein
MVFWAAVATILLIAFIIVSGMTLYGAFAKEQFRIVERGDRLYYLEHRGFLGLWDQIPDTAKFTSIEDATTELQRLMSQGRVIKTFSKKGEVNPK